MAGPLIEFGWNDNIRLHPKQQRFLALTTKLLNSISHKGFSDNGDGMAVSVNRARILLYNASILSSPAK